MSIVQDAIKAEMDFLIKESTNLKEKISTAKTRVKKQFFTKKLKKNNTKLARVLYQLNVLQEQKK